MIKVILWDMDGTLLNFKASESASIKSTFKHFGLGECSDDMVLCYSKINQGYWEQLERGEVTKEQVLRCRFEDFLRMQGINNIDPMTFCEEYELGLSKTIVYVENSLELLNSLKDNYTQFIVTNGSKDVQLKKLKKSGFDKVIDNIFISDEIGYEKPSRLFFEAVLNLAPNVKLDEILIVGDSLTSDIRGGNNIGIKTCFYNPENIVVPSEYKVDYIIKNLNEIKDIL